MNHKATILLTYFFINSCTTFDSSFDTAETLPPSKMTTAVSLNINVQQEKSVYERLVDGSPAIDPYLATVGNGLMIYHRWGLVENFDLQFNLSLDQTSIGGKFNYFKYNKFYAAIGLKYLTPLFAIDHGETHSYMLTLYQSYVIGQGFHAFVNPIWIHKKNNLGYVGLSIGSFFGEQNRLGFEWSYFVPEKIKHLETIEQVKVGYQIDIEDLWK